MRYSAKSLFTVLATAFLLLDLAIAAAGAASPSSQIVLPPSRLALPSSQDSRSSFQSLGIQLIGIVSSESKSCALIAVKGAKNRTLVSEGDVLETSAGDYTVQRIAKVTVELRKGNEQQILGIRGMEMLTPATVKNQKAKRPSPQGARNESNKTPAKNVKSGKTAKTASWEMSRTAKVPTMEFSTTRRLPRFQRPMEGWISSPFGLRRAPSLFSGLRGSERHEGTDIAAPLGSAVFAAAAGVVIKSSSPVLFDPRGRHVVIRHSGGYETHYYHLSRRYVKCGDTVRAGQRIASEGNTGVSTGPHLHFEIRRNGVAFDPVLFVPSLLGR